MQLYSWTVVSDYNWIPLGKMSASIIVLRWQQDLSIKCDHSATFASFFIRIDQGLNVCTNRVVEQAWGQCFRNHIPTTGTFRDFLYIAYIILWLDLFIIWVFNENLLWYKKCWKLQTCKCKQEVVLRPSQTKPEPYLNWIEFITKNI